MPQSRSLQRLALWGSLVTAVLLAASMGIESLSIPAQHKKHLAAVRHLQSIGFAELSKEATVFSREDYGLYLRSRPRFIRTRDFPEGLGFAEVHRRFNIQATVLSPFLVRHDALLNKDPEWQALLADPAAWGYIALPMPLPIPGLPVWTLLVSESVHEQLNP